MRVPVLPDSYLNEGLVRVCEMCKECISEADAVPYWYYSQSLFPYFTMQVAPYVPVIDSEVIELRPYVLILRYHKGHRTGSELGSVEYELYQEIPLIESFFAQRLGLQSECFPTEQDFLDPTGTYITLSRGLSEFDGIGSAAQSTIGCEFHLRLAYAIVVEQVYYEESLP